MRGGDCVILAVEKKSVLQLQDPRTVRKTAMLDDHVCLGFAGTLSSFSLRISPRLSGFSVLGWLTGEMEEMGLLLDGVRLGREAEEDGCDAEVGLGLVW